MDDAGAFGLSLQASVVAETRFHISSGVPTNFVRGWGTTNSVEDRGNGYLADGSPLVKCYGGSCKLLQKISFHIVKLS